MTKIDALYLSHHQKTPDHLIHRHVRPLVRDGDRRFSVLGVGERHRRMVFGLLCRQSSAAVLLCLQVRFCSCNRRLRRIEFGGTASGRTRRRSCDNRLASVAHFLYWRRSSAAEQTGDTDQDKNEPRHRMQRH